jgi:hypothetical protein
VEVVNQIFFLFTLLAPVGVGAAMVLFNRRFSVEVLRYQKMLLKIEYGETYRRMLQVFAIVAGAILVVGGLVVAVQTLLG